MAKRTRFEASGDEYDYVVKCMKCKHSYIRQEESDMLFCRLKECRYEIEEIHDTLSDTIEETPIVE